MDRSGGALMGRLTVKVPDVGEGVAEVELVSWAVAEGESVQRNQMVAEVMTDKATVEVPSPVDGVVAGLSGAAGDKLLVGEALFVLEVDGEGETVVDAVTADPPTPASPPTPSSPVAPAPPEPSNPPAPPAGPGPGAAPRSPAGAATAPRPEGRKPTAAPSVRRRARDAGIDLRAVAGTGPAGRITHDDLDQVFRRPGGPTTGPGRPAVAVADQTVTDQPIIGLRRRIADQMVASASTIPHITYVDEVDLTALEELRSSLNDRAAPTGLRLTILPFLVRALVRVLPDFPMCNAHVLAPESPPGDGDGAVARDRAGAGDEASARPSTLRTFGGVHVGIATQTERGLVVPVLHHAEAETLWSTAARLSEVTEAARSGQATPGDLSGSTITITSLGALGGLVTTPIINQPETTIIGVNKLAVRPVWDGERFAPRSMMNLSSSFDHRVVDGWDAANFVQAVKALLEQPALLFVEDPLR